MHDHHLMTLANDTIAERRAEADRARLARSSRQAPSRNRRAGSHSLRRSVSLILGRATLS